MMGKNPPKKYHFFKKAYLCFLAIFSPKKLDDLEKENSLSNDEADEPRAYIVNRAFWESFLLIILFGGIGLASGLLFLCGLGKPSDNFIVILQSLGASLLLWGTLFVRGWEIQSWKGQNLTEKVNHWIYRTLYCIGTSILICSIVWSLA